MPPSARLARFVKSWPVVGVVGGSGGAGASTFAAVVALGASELSSRPVLLIDLDPIGGGLDVLLGLDSTAGARWSAVSKPGGALHAVPAAPARWLRRAMACAVGPRRLRRRRHRPWAGGRRYWRTRAAARAARSFAAFPQWASVAVLSADTPRLPLPEVASRVVDRARAKAPVVVDLSRCPSATRDVVLDLCAGLILVARCQRRAIAATRTVRQSLPGLSLRLIVRSGDWIAARRVSALVDARLAGHVPSYQGLIDPVTPSSVPPALIRLASTILQELAG